MCIKRGTWWWFSELEMKYLEIAAVELAYQYVLSYSLPIHMLSNHYCFHWSRLMDLIRVMVGPSDRWAPEQLEQTKTPKSREAPI
jgi:hypothetical protein